MYTKQGFIQKLKTLKTDGEGIAAEMVNHTIDAVLQLAEQLEEPHKCNCSGECGKK